MGDKHDRPGIYFTGFVCVKCGAAYPPDRDLLLCPACDNLLEAEYDYARLARDLDRDGLWRRPPTVWRWVELLPVRDPGQVVTRYCHLVRRPDVVEGQQVATGQVLGYVGTSGNSARR